MRVAHSRVGVKDKSDFCDFYRRNKERTPMAGGRLVRFDLQAIDSWLEDQRVEPREVWRDSKVREA